MITQKWSVVMMILLFIYACKTKPTEANSKLYDLQFNSMKEKNFKNVMKMKMRASSGFGPLSVGVDMKMDAFNDFVFLPDSSGFKRLQLTYDSMHYEMDMSELQKVATLGGAKKDEIKTPDFSSFTDKMRGKSLVLIMNDTAGIVAIQGMEQFVNQLQTDENESPEVARQRAAMVSQMNNKEFLMQNVGYMFDMYPAKLVKLGDSWQKAAVNNMNGMKFTINNIYTLDAVKNNVATIKVDGIIVFDFSSLKNMPKEMGEMKMEGSQKGYYYIDLNSKLLTNSDVEMKIDMKVPTGSISVPVKMKANYTIKSK